MSETPEVIEAEIAVLQAKLTEAQQETEAQVAALKIEELAIEAESDAAPVIDPEVVSMIAELKNHVESVTGVPVGVSAPVAAAVITIPVPAAPAPHAAQTIPARWALQPLAR